MRNAWMGLLLLSSLALMTGCQQEQPASDPNGNVTDAESKTKKTVDGQLYEGNGFTMGLPKNWKVVDLSKGTFDDAIAKLKDDPSFAQVKKGAEAIQANKSVKLFALAPDHSTPTFGANLNVLEVPIPANVTASQVFKANEEQLKSVTKKDMKFTQFKAGKADAGRVEWVMPMSGQNMAMTTVIAVANNTQYVFTFTMPEAKNAAAKPEIEKTIKSIDFK